MAIFSDFGRFEPDENRVFGQRITRLDGAAIIICLASSKYELSKNCRKELSYADVKNVPIFTCLVEDDYVGNGWLGIIISPLLYFDFRGDRVGKGLVEAMQKKLGDDSEIFKPRVQ